MKFGLKIVALYIAVLGSASMVLPGQVAVAEGTGIAATLAGSSLSIPKGKGEACIAPTNFMRRNHMNMLKHDRDDTVHFGNREIKASLKECVSCHAVNGADNTPITVEDPKHFCRSCHDYVAVKIDCFECHASRPDQTLESNLDKAKKENQALAAYVKGTEE